MTGQTQDTRSICRGCRNVFWTYQLEAWGQWHFCKECKKKQAELHAHYYFECLANSVEYNEQQDEDIWEANCPCVVCKIRTNKSKYEHDQSGQDPPKDPPVGQYPESGAWKLKKRKDGSGRYFWEKNYISKDDLEIE